VRGWIGLVIATLLASGCMVTRATYEAELAAGESLRHELELRELRISELEVRIRDLETTRETLELEQRSLGEERLQLIADLNALRGGNEELRAKLEAERDVRQRQETEIAELGGTYQRLVDELEREVATGQIEIQRLRGQLHVRALEQILFDSGSTTIKPEGTEVLAKVAAQIRQIPDHRVRVEGHTDTVPIATARFPSNWELSAARAAGVVRFLVEQGLDPALLEAVGRGAHLPIADNATREGRARNRRIEIVLVPDEGG
jgi:chemotaxis protein MotB